MRYFNLWKMPTESGDIYAHDYLFLGNYVDKGQHSLEVICLLMALKLKYPKQVTLLRGNHEDKQVNRHLGFGAECIKRLGEDIEDPNSCFAKINEMFEYMPLAAIVGKKNKMFCCHGGIGPSVQDIESIEAIQRPHEIKMGSENTDNQRVIDLLWSDPHESETENGFQHNEMRDPQRTNNITKFGADNLTAFLKRTDMGMMVRSHSIVPSGIERFSDNLISITSASNHSGTQQNEGCFLVIQKQMIVMPKIIKAQPESDVYWQDVS